MKRFFFLVAILLCTVSGAQERFSCRFKMVERESGKTIAEGKGYVQGDCYRLETEWMQVWCNGKDRWIWSSSSEELVIEPNDVSFLKDIDVTRRTGGKAVIDYEGYTITLTDIQEKAEPWSGTFFIIDPELFGDNTIITDLR